MRTRLSDAWAWLRAMVEGDEVLVVGGLVLVTAGLWPLVDQVALVVPGLVLLWIGLPQRTTFMARPAETHRKGDV